MKVVDIGGALAAVVEYRGNTHYFLFNGYVMFALQERFGNEFARLVAENTPEGIEALPQIAGMLAEQGELARRRQGYDAQPIPEGEAFGTPLVLQPFDILALRGGCVAAFSLGYTRQVAEDDEEVDLGLLELQKKRDCAGPST